MGGGVENTKKNGFTLAELLAVIAILGVISLIAFPAVNKVIKNSQEKAYTAQKEIILSSAKNWGLDNLNSLSEEENTYLSIEELKQGGYLEAKQVVNPITEEEMNGCIIINYDNNYNQFVYSYNETSCIDLNDIPIITLNGNKTITIALNGTYTELGAKAKYREQDISSSIGISGTVDTTKIGSYTIKYNVTYDGKKAKEVTRIVKVMDQNPLIELIPNKTEGYQKATIVKVAVTPSRDNTITRLTYQLDGSSPQDIVNNQIILETDGEHTLIVKATDNQGNTKTVTSGLYQIDVTPPTITFLEGDNGLTLKPDEVENYDLKSGITVEDNHEITLDNVTTSGELSSLEGTYSITYIATDIAGNTTEKTRSITVVMTKTFSEIMNNSSEVMTNDPDGNPRYVGPDPDNYVWFNNELWRIIGVFDGQAKIIRNEPYNTYIAFDKNQNNGGHGDYGWHDWNQSTLKTELNTNFFNGIEDLSRSYIDKNHTWNIGAASSTENDWTRVNMYNYERGSLKSSTMISTIFNGAIGLIYPSDYGYATSSTKSSCNITVMGSWNNEAVQTECANKSWLKPRSSSSWTLTPRSTPIHNVFEIHANGHIFGGFASGYAYGGSATPVLYLKPTVKISSGLGTKDQPFILTNN